MRKVTLCFLIDKNKVCLAMKKRGFGVGKWNGVGGKTKEGEGVKEAAIREMGEEIGVRAKTEDLEEVGNIKFYFNEKPDWNQQMHIFFVKKWKDEPQESEEMLPKWYPKDQIPYTEMWVDDEYWLPKALAGKKIEAEFYFKGDGEDLEKYEVREI